MLLLWSLASVFETMPTDQTVIEDKRVVFKCRAKYPYRISWLRVSNRIKRDL